MEAKACSLVLLGSKKWFEDALRIFAWDAMAVIRDHDVDLPRISMNPQS